jgi:PLP dependent protein
MDDPLISAIRDRYQKVLDQITQAASRSGRSLQAIKLVTVTKSQPLDIVRAVISAGASILGENYPEEALPKITTLKGSGVEWHMIGHVQGRKAGLVAGNFTMLHSLDSSRLARKLDRFCAEQGRDLPVLLEVNLSGEQSKFGFPAWDEQNWSKIHPELEEILGLAHLHVRGLMTMPPLSEDPEQARPFFQKMRRLQDYLAKHYPQSEWTELSMGTSVDFVAAVEEGATLVRVGQSIVGPRSVEKRHAD